MSTDSWTWIQTASTFISLTCHAKVFGTLTITSAASEVNFTHYHVYYGPEIHRGRDANADIGL